MKPWETYKRVWTPGPWAPGSLSLDRRAGRYIRPVSGGTSICQITVHRRNWRENARLIAAAPLMFSLVKSLVKGGMHFDELNFRVTQIVDLVEGRVSFPQPSPYRCPACDVLSQEPKAGCHHKEEPERD